MEEWRLQEGVEGLCNWEPVGGVGGGGVAGAVLDNPPPNTTTSPTLLSHLPITALPAHVIYIPTNVHMCRLFYMCVCVCV